MSEPTPRVSLITTCKGRLGHLRQSLPKMVAQGDRCEVIVVDYDCPEGAGDWVHHQFPQVCTVRVADAPEFNVSEARNRGARFARADWLMFVDADILLEPGLCERLVPLLREGHYFRPRLIAPDLHGTVACARRDFVAIGGYDEALPGWGGEDRDFYFRLNHQLGRKAVWFPAEWLSFLPHGDDQRVRFTDLRDKALSQITNAWYRYVKADLWKLSGGTYVPLSQRLQIHQRVRQAVVDASASGSQRAVISLDVSSLPGVVLPRGCSIRRRLSYEFRSPTLKLAPEHGVAAAAFASDPDAG